ncbi:hypothetical protein QAD02_010461 [Eretmocerus hayati]|uniref:Uncharacterized protein n=1 Tax=Eretmocerus hayati TaxID=131215 RepID=A0ACC2NTZ0_9HYME|nr:hypothetical protein QAD02_010461 [Eretmocerus hayati]
MSERNQVVLKEQTFTLDNGTMFKPDLVTRVNESTAQIVDVTLRFERSNSLTVAANEKQAKYNNIIPMVKRQLGVSKVEVIPLAIGSRGGLPRWVEGNMKRVGMRRSDSMTVVMIALRSSIEMVASFLDYG